MMVFAHDKLGVNQRVTALSHATGAHGSAELETNFLRSHGSVRSQLLKNSVI